eukprot:12466599-Heterocapsa_arctica.AAC.1
MKVELEKEKKLAQTVPNQEKNTKEDASNKTQNQGEPDNNTLAGDRPNNVERKYIQQLEFQQNKRPRIEETEDNKDTNTNLNNKRKAEQDQLRDSQTTKKTKTDNNTYRIPPSRGTFN